MTLDVGPPQFSHACGIGNAAGQGEARQGKARQGKAKAKAQGKVAVACWTCWQRRRRAWVRQQRWSEKEGGWRRGHSELMVKGSKNEE